MSIALAALAGAVACASPYGSPLPFPAQRVRLGLFSFLPPNEPGWVRTPSASNDGWGWDAAAPATYPDESYAFQVYVGRVTPFAGGEDALLADARAGMDEFLKAATAADAPSERFAVEAADASLWKGHGTTCVRRSFIALDRDPVRRSGSHAAMKLTVVQFDCAHPREPRTAILLAFSQRCAPSHEDPELGARAESLAEEIEFLDAPQ